jgi:hypothetical protein
MLNNKSGIQLDSLTSENTQENGYTRTLYCEITKDFSNNVKNLIIKSLSNISNEKLNLLLQNHYNGLNTFLNYIFDDLDLAIFFFQKIYLFDSMLNESLLSKVKNKYIQSLSLESQESYNYKLKKELIKILEDIQFRNYNIDLE